MKFVFQLYRKILRRKDATQPPLQASRADLPKTQSNCGSEGAITSPLLSLPRL